MIQKKKKLILIIFSVLYIVGERPTNDCDDNTTSHRELSVQMVLNTTNHNNILTYTEVVNKVKARFNNKTAMEVARQLLVDGSEVVPIDLVRKDMTLLVEHKYELRPFIQEAINRLQRRQRLCVASVNADYRSFDEVIRLRDLANWGARVKLPMTWKPNGKPNGLRPGSRNMEEVFLIHALKLWRAERVIILPIHVLKHITGQLHFSAAHWAVDHNKPLGRFIVDCTNASEGASINEEESTNWSKDYYGKSSLPSIIDIVGSVKKQEHVGRQEDVMLWKFDVASAFNQFTLSQDTAQLFAVQITAHLFMIYLCGLFGWASAPIIFAVISRALQWRLELVLEKYRTKVEIYVDDICGISVGEDNASEALSTTVNTVSKLLGPEAANNDKCVKPTRKLEMIGWCIDLDERIVYPNEKAICKLIYYCEECAKTQGVAPYWRHFEALASSVRRLVIVYEGMEPFISALYNMGVPKAHTPREKEMGLICVDMWRVLGYAVYSMRNRLSVNFNSVGTRLMGTTVEITSDASPTGIGFVIRGGACQHLCWYAGYKLPYECVESQYQNIREYQGLILAMLALIKLEVKKVHIKWLGDNVSALQWTSKKIAKSQNAFWSCCVHTWLRVLADMHITAKHIPGITMGEVDGLSRGSGAPTLEGLGGIDLSTILQNDSDIERILMICNPISTAQLQPSMESVRSVFETVKTYVYAQHD